MIPDEDLQRVVDLFYARVREDELIGPVFNGAVHDWPEHLVKLGAFWSSVINRSGRFKGNPMAAHLKHKSAIDSAMFERWLQLWRETASETLPPPGAELVIDRAERIAESLQLGLFFRIGPDGRAAA